MTGLSSAGVGWTEGYVGHYQVPPDIDTPSDTLLPWGSLFQSLTTPKRPSSAIRDSCGARLRCREVLTCRCAPIVAISVFSRSITLPPEHSLPTTFTFSPASATRWREQ